VPAGVSAGPSPAPAAPPTLPAGPTEAPAASLAAPSQALPTPTAVALEAVTSPEDARALAAVPEGTVVPSGPTAVVLPPSARLAVALTPTPDVVASSPSLAGGSPAIGSADYAGAIKLVQDSRKAPGAPRLSERIEAAIARAQATGSEIEVLGWQAALKGSTDTYQVTFSLRENRQGLRAEWEVNMASGEVRSVNGLAEALDAS
jgi:hypothetical protein